MKKISEKNKIIFLFVGAFIVMIISAIVLILSWRDSKKESELPTDERVENIDLTQFDNKDVIQNSIIYNLDNKGKNRGCKLLSKYSEDYVSVMQWMLNTVCNKMNTEGFIVSDYIIYEGRDESEAVDVDGLEKYGSAENYITELLNNNPDTDISDLLLSFCPDEYYALKNTYILGKEENKEYGESESQMLYTDLLERYCSGDYERVIQDIDGLLEQYKLTMPYNYPLCNLYQDAKSAINYDMDTNAIIYGLGYMHSAETYLSNFLKLTNSEKADIVLDKSSVCPFAQTHGIITNVFDAEDGYTNNFKDLYSTRFTEYTKVKGFDFYIGDTNDTSNTYQAYMLCDYRNNTFYIVSIKSTGEKNVYQTAEQIKGIGIISNSTEETEENSSNSSKPNSNRFYIETAPTEIEYHEIEQSSQYRYGDEEESESESDTYYNEDEGYDYDDDYDYNNDYEENSGVIISEQYID